MLPQCHSRSVQLSKGANCDDQIPFLEHEPGLGGDDELAAFSANGKHSRVLLPKQPAGFQTVPACLTVGKHEKLFHRQMRAAVPMGVHDVQVGAQRELRLVASRHLVGRNHAIRSR